MKRTTLCTVIALAGAVAFAQEKNYKVLDGSTTGTFNYPTTGTMHRATTGTVDMDAARTSASAIMARRLSPENFEKRWEMEADLYKKAGISDEKIEKMRAINEKIWKARASGEKIDFQALSRERSEILDQDDINKFREARRGMMEQQMKAHSANPGTTSTM